MTKPLRLASCFFFAATLYDLFAVTIQPILHLPDLGDRLFVAVCILFTLTHCLILEGPRRTAIFFTVSAVVSFCFEEIGVRTGLIYGPYHYTAMLGARIGHVPVILPLASFMMIYPAWVVATILLEGTPVHTLPGRTAHALAAAWVITAWDMVMDPGMAASGNWIWERGGAYFGVPRHNYLGWLLTTFLVYFLVATLWRTRTPRPRTSAASLFDRLPLLVYAAIAARYVFYTPIPALQVIALFTMGTPALLALTRAFLPTHPLTPATAQ